MAKRFSKRRGSKMHRRTRRGGNEAYIPWANGGRKKMMRTRRRTRRGGLAGNIGAATGDVRFDD